MIRLKMIVEGQSEERFVDGLLVRHLADRGVMATPWLVTTGRKRGRVFKGGLGARKGNYARLKKEIQKTLIEDQNPEVRLTTFVDLYALPVDFPEYETSAQLAPRDRITRLEEAFAADINSDRFLPYIQLHEFESLLFAEIERLVEYYPSMHAKVDALKQEVECFGDPELINDGATTAPSKRIGAHIVDYDKVTGGVLTALGIGLDRMRESCSHFNDWVTQLETLDCGE